MKILIVCPLEYEYKKAKEVFNTNEPINCHGFKVVSKRINNNEIFIIKSGLGKTRAGIATISGIDFFKPDFVVDTGTCGGLGNNIHIGTLLISYHCFEYDISGFGLPLKKQKIMEIHSGFNKNIAEIIQNLYNNKREISIGIQACGEFIIKENNDKMLLRNLFKADACNWESSGVFIGALSRKKPCLSIRVVSDLADKNIFSDFKKTVSGGLFELYGFIKDSIQKDLFHTLMQVWNTERILLYY